MAFGVKIEKVQVVKGRVTLIDADVIAYQAAYGFDDASVRLAQLKVDSLITNIMEATQGEYKLLFLTGSNNFRANIARLQRYKGNRYAADGTRITPQPRHLSAVRSYLVTEYSAELQDGQEADDALSITQTLFNKAPGWQSVISSIDKDLHITPGFHHCIGTTDLTETDVFGRLEPQYNKKTGAFQALKGYGLHFFYAQLLMGDSTDNIPGLPYGTPAISALYGIRKGGIGAKGAYNILVACKTEYECFERVAFCYASYWVDFPHVKPFNPVKPHLHFYDHNKPVHWKTKEPLKRCPWEMLTEQGQLLWMRDAVDQMWTPPQELVDRYIKEAAE